jgi:RNA polymerase sigma-70 factor (ECF subfamily)
MAAGDESALEALFDTASGLLFALAVRVTADRRDAEEALLDAYAKAWRTAATFDGSRGSARTWLIMMTRSAALDRRRRAGRPADRLEVAKDDAASDEQPADEQLDEKRRRVRVRRALQVLPIEQREAVELAFFDGLSHSQLASRLGLPLGTVKTRIRLGMRRLDQLLGEGAE